MAAKLTELTLVYLREKIRWDDVAIIECDEPRDSLDSSDRAASPTAGGLSGLLKQKAGVIVKAESCPEGELVQGLSYRFYGRWIEHDKHGRQFVAKTYVRVQPHGRAGVIRYLTTTCAGHGVGEATAKKLWDRFGGDAVRILREDPEVAAAAVGMQHFTDEKAAAASVVLKGESALEAVHIDLIDLLGGRGFPRDVAKQSVAEWGNKAAVLIRRNPYLLMRFPRTGFLRCDQLYLDQGGRPAALKRQALAAWHAIAKDSDGHTWFRPDVAEYGIRGRVSGAEVEPLAALKLAKRAKMLAVHRNGDDIPWLAEAKKAENEQTVADYVRAMMVGPNQWPEVGGGTCPRCNGGGFCGYGTGYGDVCDECGGRGKDGPGLDVSEHQAMELEKALRSPIALFGGSPGTGKTYSAARLIGRIIDLCGCDQVAVCAPTGKAAVRITEALAGYEITLTATTIHRLLGVASRSAGEGWGFQHDETNPLDRKYIIVDESSMIDTNLMASLLRACPTGAHVLLVGDVNQLPPVGHGAPLRDMLAAGVPAGELTKIERNWGTIVQACADIRDGKRWQTVDVLDPDAGKNLKLLPAANSAAAVETIVATILKIRDSQLYDPIWGVQVICAVNQKSELSRRALNKRLQAELNPAGERCGSNPFRVGDKIVCLKNSLMPICEDAPLEYNRDAADNKVFTANGELGRVVEVAEKLTTVSMDAPKRLIKIPRGAEGGSKDDAKETDANGQEQDDSASTSTGCNWDLAYAISCHKSQGSEWPCVIVALDEYPGARRICDRSWLYTAISRAKNVCLMVGKRSTADEMCMTQSIRRRKTFLKELIQEEQS